jgi:hypothetical protein
MKNNLEEAERIRKKMLKEEGKDFTNFALDGIIEKELEKRK